MPFTTFVAGDVLTAARLNTDLRNQVVTPFATTSARDSAITAPVAGMVCVTTDTNTVWTYSGSAWVQSVQNGAWTAWTPTLQQAGVVSATVTHAVYARWGRLIIVNFRLSVTGTGAATNAVQVSLPVTSARATSIIGTGVVYDASVGLSYTGNVALTSTTALQFEGQGQGVSPSTLGATGSAFTAALATGDVISASLTYEAAS